MSDKEKLVIDNTYIMYNEKGQAVWVEVVDDKIVSLFTAELELNHKPEYVVPKELQGTIFEKWVKNKQQQNIAPIQLQHKLPEEFVGSSSGNIFSAVSNDAERKDAMYNAIVELQEIVSKLIEAQQEK